MSLGKRVEDERKRRDWTQTQLAAKVEGLTQQAVDRLEKRDSKTSEHAVGIAHALQIYLRWLLNGEGRRDDADWPFDRVERSRWDACNDVDRGYIQAAFNRALDECEANRQRGTVAPIPQTLEDQEQTSAGVADRRAGLSSRAAADLEGKAPFTRRGLVLLEQVEASLATAAPLPQSGKSPAPGRGAPSVPGARKRKAPAQAKP